MLFRMTSLKTIINLLKINQAKPVCISPTVHEPAVIGNLRVRALFFDSRKKLSSFFTAKEHVRKMVRNDVKQK